MGIGPLLLRVMWSFRWVEESKGKKGVCQVFESDM